jgi:hypothetical protein
LTIGMLGGMSWESSAEYYRLVNEFVRDRLGGLHSARCVLVSVDFAEIEQLQATGAWDKAAAVLARAARQIEAGGADLLVLCTNTVHKVAAQVQGIILGCTEIELLVTQADSPVPVFPTTRLHAQAAVERALAPTRRRLHTSQREECAAASDASRAASGDDVAHALGWAVFGVKGGGPLGQLPQFATQLLELQDALIEVGGVALKQVGDMGAGGLPVVAEGDDLADLAQGEADRLGSPDEPEAPQDRLVVAAVARGGAGRRGQDADLLVVADGLGRDVCLVGELTDAHGRLLPS